MVAISAKIGMKATIGPFNGMKATIRQCFRTGLSDTGQP